MKKNNVFYDTPREPTVGPKVLYINPIRQQRTALDREEGIKLTSLWSKLVKENVGNSLTLDKLVEEIKTTFGCEETNTCRKLYGGHSEFENDDILSLLQVPDSSEQAAYKKEKEKGNADAEALMKNFDTFFYIREEGCSFYLGSLGLQHGDEKKLSEKVIVHKTDLIKFGFEKPQEKEEK